jgi:hypothetical protein
LQLRPIPRPRRLRKLLLLLILDFVLKQSPHGIQS